MPSKTQQLKDLADLLDRGLLTREEFDLEKERILGGPPSTHSIPKVPDPAEAEADGPAPPQALGSYRILEQVQVDALGAVYRAKHKIDSVAERQGGEVLLRVVHPELAADSDYIDRIKAEANPGLKLQHVGIAKVLSATIEDGLVLVATRPTEGRRLSDLLDRGVLTRTESKQIVNQLIEAIGYAHSRGVVHGWIQPQGVVVQADGGVVIYDTGLAKPRGSILAARPGAEPDSLAFIAPERFDSTEVDDRADVWSLGLLLYRMLAGRMPWDPRSDTETIRAFKLAGTLPSHPNLGSSADAILQATATNPDDRFVSVTHLEEALAAGAANTATVPQPARPVPGAQDVVSAAFAPFDREPTPTAPDEDSMFGGDFDLELDLESVAPGVESLEAQPAPVSTVGTGTQTLPENAIETATAPLPDPQPAPPSPATIGGGGGAAAASTDDDDEPPAGKKKKKGSCLLQGCMGCATLLLILMGVVIFAFFKYGVEGIVCEAARQSDQPDIWQQVLDNFPEAECAQEARVALGLAPASSLPQPDATPEPTPEPGEAETPSDGGDGSGDSGDSGDGSASVEPATAAPTPEPSTPEPATPADEDTIACDRARGEATVSGWQRYLDRFPVGRCAGRARRFISDAETASAEPTPRATPEPTPTPRATPEPTPEPATTPEPTPEPAATPEPTPEPVASTKEEGPSDFVVSTIVTNNAGVKRCVRSERDRGRDVPNPLSIKFTVNPDGSVTRARVSSSGFEGTSLDTCVSREINQLAFPPWDGDRKKVTFQLPTN